MLMAEMAPENNNKLDRLKQLLKKTSWKATTQIISFLTESLGKKPKAILLTGLGGVGKTSLIQLLTGEQLLVGNSLNSGTREYAIIPAIIDGDEYLFIDAPGFETADLGNLTAFQEIVTGLTAISSFVKIVGILYITDIVTDRATMANETNLRWLEGLCGTDFFPYVTFVTTKWDQWGPEKLDEKKEQIEEWKSRWSRFLSPENGSPGAKLYHHGIPGGGKSDSTYWGTPLKAKRETHARSKEAKQMMLENYHDANPGTLLLLDELNRGIPVDRTSAARALMPENTVNSDSRNPEGKSTSGSAESSRTPNQGSTSSTPEGHHESPQDSESPLQTAERWVRLLLKAATAIQKLRTGGTVNWSPWDSSYDDGFDTETIYEAFGTGHGIPEEDDFDPFLHGPSDPDEDRGISCSIL